MKDLSKKKCRAVLKTDFIIPMMFDTINYKGSKGIVRKADNGDKEDYVFTPYHEGGKHELWVYESDLEFY